MINTVLFDMGGTLEDIWYNDQTIQDVTRKLLTFLQEHDMVTGSNEICFWNKINNGIRRYKQWSEGNALELKPEEIWPQYYLSEFDLDTETFSDAYVLRACLRKDQVDIEVPVFDFRNDFGDPERVLFVLPGDGGG